MGHSLTSPPLLVAKMLEFCWSDKIFNTKGAAGAAGAPVGEDLALTP